MSKTTKQISAFRQISAAIDHFDKQNYECAITLADDERFRDLNTRWTFWLVSNDMNDFVKKQIRSSGRPIGMLWQSEDVCNRFRRRARQRPASTRPMHARPQAPRRQTFNSDAIQRLYESAD
jgi:hypothetical protein